MLILFPFYTVQWLFRALVALGLGRDAPIPSRWDLQLGPLQREAKVLVLREGQHTARVCGKLCSASSIRKSVDLSASADGVRVRDDANAVLSLSPFSREMFLMVSVFTTSANMLMNPSDTSNSHSSCWTLHRGLRRLRPLSQFRLRESSCRGFCRSRHAVRDLNHCGQVAFEPQSLKKRDFDNVIAHTSGSSVG